MNITRLDAAEIGCFVIGLILILTALAMPDAETLSGRTVNGTASACME